MSMSHMPQLISRYSEKFVVNFTDDSFYTYANDGTPIKIKSEVQKDIPKKPDSGLVLIVSKEKYQELKESGRSTSDLAKLGEPTAGIDDLPMQIIMLYDNERTRVMPINNSLHIKRC